MLLKKSPRKICRIRIRNYGIMGANFLNLEGSVRSRARHPESAKDRDLTEAGLNEAARDCALWE
jgi:hypothetical protein